MIKKFSATNFYEIYEEDDLDLIYQVATCIDHCSCNFLENIGIPCHHLLKAYDFEERNFSWIWKKIHPYHYKKTYLPISKEAKLIPNLNPHLKSEDKVEFEKNYSTKRRRIKFISSNHK